MKNRIQLAMLALPLLAATAPAWDELDYTGLHCASLGGAVLTIDPPTGHARISNIGSSGLDGVRVYHPHSEGLDLEFAPIFAVPPGMRWDIRTVGSFGSGPDQVLSQLEVEEFGGVVTLEATYPAAPNLAKRIRYVRNGAVVFELGGQTGAEIGTIVPTSVSVPVPTDRHIEAEIVGYDPLGNPMYRFHETVTYSHVWVDDHIREFARVRVPVPPYHEIDVDLIDIECGPISGPLQLAHTDVYARSIPDLLIEAQGPIVLGGRSALGLGSARLTNDLLVSGNLLVDAVGASGGDGVAVWLPNSEDFEMAFGNLPQAGTLPMGAHLQFAVDGVLGGDEKVELFRLLMTKSSGPLVVDASAPGAASFLVELRNGGALVASEVMPGTNLLRVGPFPRRIRSLDLNDLGLLLSAEAWLEWNMPVGMTIPGHGNHFADEVRIVAIGSSSEVARVDFARLTGRHLGSFEVAAIVATSVPLPTAYCTAKTNSLGCVPAMGFAGEASFSLDSLELFATEIINQKLGVLITGFQSASTPFQGGLLCVKAPLRRSAPISSGGSAAGTDCTGVLRTDFDAALAGSYGLAPGDVMFVQFWYRDPAAASTTGLTDALRVPWRP